MCLAVPGRVLTIYAERGTTMADVDFGGARKKVCLAYLPETQVGEYVIVHVGFAIQRLDEASALETLATFERMGLLAEEFGEPSGEPFGEAGREAAAEPDGKSRPAVPQ
ncbi:MAG: HypC/HybG/HupF family hydrogenase formation chaperone [Austwickia sp.]|nr:HypC/HybG/HupF family hydrogenase formation chaperone [Actinomycetota bacterium]MCB1253240.1 HypC/HybG/HupF family hydrogenase formation chaperone [Austwickia sp.]MCO5309082.1 HypC/HybG/HupF family hydrogenase formation chaperone [Austwickia sp.]